MKKILQFILIILLLSCNNTQEQTETLNIVHESKDIDTVKINKTKETESKPIEISPLEQSLIDAGLVNIRSIDSSIIVDLKYNSTDNFMGIILYKNLTNAYLQEDVAHRLAAVQTWLKTQNSSYSLYIFDAVRPLSVQQKMWDALDTIPVNERVKFVSNPANGSIHNYGAAVDLSIYDHKKDTLLDMGAGFDDLRKIAYPKHEDSFLKQGLLTQEQVENRKLLRKAMATQNFRVLPTEWWHFNATSREEAKQKYKLIP